MLNYFSDNQDLEFTLHNLELAEITAMLEKNYENAEKFSNVQMKVTNRGTQLTLSLPENENVFGCQFHPEKSGEVGLKILKAFCEME